MESRNARHLSSVQRLKETVRQVMAAHTPRELREMMDNFKIVLDELDARDATSSDATPPGRLVDALRSRHLKPQVLGLFVGRRPVKVVIYPLGYPSPRDEYETWDDIRAATHLRVGDGA